jgi:hypothetical protein
MAIEALPIVAVIAEEACVIEEGSEKEDADDDPRNRTPETAHLKLSFRGKHRAHAATRGLAGQRTLIDSGRSLAR